MKMGNLANSLAVGLYHDNSSLTPYCGGAGAVVLIQDVEYERKG
jgi:hypothetical protein